MCPCVCLVRRPSPGAPLPSLCFRSHLLPYLPLDVRHPPCPHLHTACSGPTRWRRGGCQAQRLAARVGGKVGAACAEAGCGGARFRSLGCGRDPGGEWGEAAALKARARAATQVSLRQLFTTFPRTLEFVLVCMRSRTGSDATGQFGPSCVCRNAAHLLFGACPVGPQGAHPLHWGSCRVLTETWRHHCCASCGNQVHPGVCWQCYRSAIMHTPRPVLMLAAQLSMRRHTAWPHSPTQ